MEFLKDAGIRTLGLGSDIANTFGSLSPLYADKFNQTTGKKVTAQNQLPAKPKAVPQASPIKAEDADVPKETQPDRISEINRLIVEQNKALGEVEPARNELIKAAERRISDSALDLNKLDIARGNLKTETSALLKEYETLFPNPNTELKKQLDDLQKSNTQSSEQAPYQSLLKFSLGLMSNKSTNFSSAVGEAGKLGLEEYSRLKNLNETKKEKLFEAESRLANANDLRSQNQFSMANKEARLAQEAREERFKLEHDEKVSKASLAYQVAQIKSGVPAEKAKMLGQQLTALLNIETTLKGPEQFRMYELIKKDKGFAQYMQDQSETAFLAKVTLDAYKQVDDNMKALALSGQDTSKMNVQDEVNKTIESAMRAYRTQKIAQKERNKPPVPVTGQ